MTRPLWFESPTGIKMYVDAAKEPDGWIVRLFDQTGKQISRIVFRVSYEIAPHETMMGELPVDVISDLMHEMRRQVMARENVFLAQPVK